MTNRLSRLVVLSTILSLVSVLPLFAEPSAEPAGVNTAEFVAPQALPATTANPVQLASGPGAAAGQYSVVTAGGTATDRTAPSGGTVDSVLGTRIARVSMDLREIPKQSGQIWREYDITPYTKGRSFPSTVQPEQTIIDWILRQTGTKLWHSAPFGILTADSEKLYVYHTKEVQLVIADIVDRFVNPQYFDEAYAIRFVTLSRPDWITRGHQYLRPIPILSPGVQGWILEKEGAQLLLQELGRRSDFKEVAPPQFSIPNGIAHNVVAKKQRTYLRDVQVNATALNGYAEDRVTIEEGFGISFVPLAVLDGQRVDAIIKLDIVQIEKMIAMMIDVPTATNPRQRMQVEAPQVACFKLDEQIRWPKGKVLLLDLGTVPLPNRQQQTESTNFFSGLTKNLSASNRSNVLLFIQQVGTVSQQQQAAPVSSVQPSSTPTILVNGQPQSTGVSQSGSALSSNPTYWNGIR